MDTIASSRRVAGMVLVVLIMFYVLAVEMLFIMKFRDMVGTNEYWAYRGLHYSFWVGIPVGIAIN